MNDPTEEYRRQRQAELNQNAQERENLELLYGQVWNTEEMFRDFDPIGFMAPFLVVRRKSDGKKGSLEFQGQPRFYFSFLEDK